jgi:hypothetical protein
MPAITTQVRRPIHRTSVLLGQVKAARTNHFDPVFIFLPAFTNVRYCDRFPVRVSYIPYDRNHGADMTDGTEKRKRGRPGTYSSDAERARAWRQRQREIVDAAKNAQPVIVEKSVIVEKIVEIERIVERPARATAKTTIKAHATPNASNLFPLLKERFTGYQGEENAKRFRTNAAKAATAAREILSLAQRGGTVPQVEEDFLRQAAQFFEHLNGIFHNAQAGAKRAAAKAEAERKAKHEARIKELVTATFGTAPAAADVLALGESLLRFDKDASEWLKKRFKVGKAYVALDREYELRGAVRNGDAAKVAREVAANRLEIGERGRRWVDGDETGYAAGWADFEEYRTNV